MQHRTFLKRTHPHSLLIALAVAVLGWTHSASAQIGNFGADNPPAAEELVSFELAADTFRIKPGQSFHLIARFSIESPWHMYWKNPGAGAAAPEIKLHLSDVLQQTGPMIWPRPHVMSSSTGDQYIYEKELAIYIPVRVSEHWTLGPSMLVSAEAFFTVCDEKRCLMGTSNALCNLSRQTNSRLGPKGFTDAEKKRLEREKAKLPYVIGADSKQDQKLGIVASIKEDIVSVRVPKRGLSSTDDIVYVPGYTGGVTSELDSIEDAEGHFLVRIRMNVNRNNIVDESPAVYGLIGLGAAEKDPSYEFVVPLSESTE